MSRRRAAAWVALFAVLGVAGGGLLRSEPSEQTARLDAGRGERVAARVVHVVDGDTVKVRAGGHSDTVRYIGVDTPESKKPGTPVQCFALAASAYNSRLVAGREVELRVGAEARDRYGRLLAYVYRRSDGLFVNAALVRGGYATLLTIPPNVAHVELFRALQRRARAAHAGLWGACR
jgi:micrococcal nuclease